MKKLRFISTIGLLVVSLLVVATSAYGGQEKVDVCHITGIYDFGDGRGEVPIGHVITIADPAYDSHIAHGDPPAHVEVTLPDGTVVCTAEIEMPETMTVFLTSSTHPGVGLGGLEGADDICQGLADDAGLEGTYKAWLSTDAESAADRLTHATVPYVLVDGPVIADNWGDLVDGSLLAPIDRDEAGSQLPEESFDWAWTATAADGTFYGYDCGDWADGTYSGYYGLAGYAHEVNSDWSQGAYSGFYCDGLWHLYCFEQ
jgi:hypothetical protein